MMELKMKDSSDLDALLTLNLIPSVGPVRVRRLRERFGSPQSILAASETQLQAVDGIGAETARHISRTKLTVDVETEKSKARDLGITLIPCTSPDYPPALLEIYDPPLVLYIKGRLPEKWHRGVGMVGTRRPSHYGLELSKKLGYQMAYAGVPVISGLARGIDTGAHQGALAAKGLTWAVLGCSLDHMYPPENQVLADKIVSEGGCLISEFPFDTKPDKQTFPMRNRIVSGLSFGVLVVEAGIKSGALITARQALEQGRQVFAIPGRIDNPESKGCHQLIKEGAKLVEDVRDVLSELEFLLPKEDVSKPKPSPVDLSPEENKILSLLDFEETPVDRIIQKSGLPSSTVSSTLLRLEMKKLVKQLPGRFFVKIN